MTIDEIVSDLVAAPVSNEVRHGGDMTLATALFYRPSHLVVWIGNCISGASKVANVPRMVGAHCAPTSLRSRHTDPGFIRGGACVRAKSRYGRRSTWRFLVGARRLSGRTRTADREPCASCQSVLERCEPRVIFPRHPQIGPVVIRSSTPRIRRQSAGGFPIVLSSIGAQSG